MIYRPQPLSFEETDFLEGLALQSALAVGNAQHHEKTTCLSAQETGGDFYYVLDSAPEKLMPVLGDVSGKGLRAAMVVSLLIGVLRETRERTPSGVLRSLNAALLRNRNSGFVTACCASFERGGVVVIAGAGHPSPFIDGRELELIPGLPLGCDADVEYAESCFDIPPDARLTFVSDGVVEAVNAASALFGFDRTCALAGNRRRRSRMPRRHGDRTTTSL